MPAVPAPAGGPPPDQVVEIFTDGACSPNPGPGGWGAILRFGGHAKELHGGEPDTTNNRMELMAAIQGLEHLTRRSAVHVYTDSVYVRNGITAWVPRWARNGWQTADKKPVKNADLWRRLADAVAAHDVEWFWVKGHAGHQWNERADQLAGLGAREATG
jgi:ribonuclease HI